MICNNYYALGSNIYIKLNDSSEFMEHMRNMREPKSWFNERKAILSNFYNPSFSEIITKRGLGFTFNMIDAEDLLTNNVSKYLYYTYNQNNSLLNDRRPWHVKSENEFTITFNQSRYWKRESEICQKNAFYVHSIDDYPLYIDFDKRFKKFDRKESILVLITPNVVTTDEELRSLSPEKRRCLFNDERKLKYFKLYSKSNCEKECYSDFTYENCSCVLYDYFRNDSMKVCDMFESHCASMLRSAQNNIHARTYAIIECDCPPECNQITYEVEYLTAKLNENYSDINSNQSILTFKYKVDEIYPLRRYQSFTIYDCISYAGGLLGLFAGISFLSIIEFIYFFTLRLFVDIYRYLRLK